MSILAGVPDATVTYVALLPEEFEGAKRVGRFGQAKPGALLLNVPDVATYLIEDGKTIRIRPVEGAEPAAVDLFLHGAARAALLHQRGDLPLHAAALVPPGGKHAIALCGDSGSGKSTLAVEMYRRGWTVLADDTTRISVEDGHPVAWSSGRGVKLWQDTCNSFGLNVERLEQVRREMKKFYYPIALEGERLPLVGVAEMACADQPPERIETIPERMNMLTRHTFRQRQIIPLGMLPHHLMLVARIAPRLQCARLGCPRSVPVQSFGDRMEEIAQWLAR